MKAWELLSKEDAWVRGSFALDQNGDICSSNADEACSWCTLGAINKCYPEYDLWCEVITKVEERLSRDVGCKLVTVWNDNEHRTQEEVVALLKELDV